MEEGIVREGFRGPDLEILGTGSWTLGGRKKSNLRAWADLRPRHWRTGQAQKERGPGFVGTSIKKSESTVDCARQHTLACVA